MSNAYLSLIDAASSLKRIDLLADIDSASDRERREFLAENRSALNNARIALEQPCSVPLKYSREFWELHLTQTQAIRNLFRAFELEMTKSQRDRQFTVAARVGVNVMDLANATRRGGLIIDLLVSNAISGLAIEHLHRLQSELEREARRQLTLELIRIHAEREDFETIDVRDREWDMRVDDSTEKQAFAELELPDDLDEESKLVIRNTMSKFASLSPGELRDIQHSQDDRQHALLWLLILESALLGYRSLNGVFPDTLDRLTPQLVPTSLYQALTKSSLCYQVKGDGFSLYAIDHDGAAIGWHS